MSTNVFVYLESLKYHIIGILKMRWNFKLKLTKINRYMLMNESKTEENVS